MKCAIITLIHTYSAIILALKWWSGNKIRKEEDENVRKISLSLTYITIFSRVRIVCWYAVASSLVPHYPNGNKTKGALLFQKSVPIWQLFDAQHYEFQAFFCFEFFFLV